MRKNYAYYPSLWRVIVTYFFEKVGIIMRRSYFYLKNLSKPEPGDVTVNDI